MLFPHLPLSINPLYDLRPLHAADLPHWYAYLTLPQVYQHTSWNLSKVDDLSPFIWCPEQITPDSQLRLGLVLRSDDSLIGTAGFHTVSSVNRSAELTYDLHPSYWGRGIAREICQVLTLWAHHTAQLNRVQATVLTSNLRSEQVLLHNGYQYEGLLRSFRMVRGQPGDFKMYAHVMT